LPIKILVIRVSAFFAKSWLQGYQTQLRAITIIDEK